VPDRSAFGDFAALGLVGATASLDRCTYTPQNFVVGVEFPLD